ncbi:MAG: histidinol-phosphate transaminase [Bacteroidales bacterium]
MFNVNKIVPDEIKKLEPYTSARETFQGKNLIFMDANENPYGNRYNRYPDPLQEKLKQQLSTTMGISTEQLFAGNGSDEIIDLVIRSFCKPGVNNLITINPSYGMYEVLASVNRIKTVKATLTEDFQINPDEILKQCDRQTKLAILCSPNNPTGNMLKDKDVEKVLQSFPGIVLVDEAYIEFSGTDGLKRKILEYPNLIITRTLSKAWGLAGIRLGYAICHPEIVTILSKVKYPYNVNNITQEKAIKALKKPQRMRRTVRTILREKQKVIEALKKLNCVEKIYPSDANFILMKTGYSKNIINFLRERNIIVRDRSNLHRCKNCIRITIGTRKQNNRLINHMQQFEKINT